MQVKKNIGILEFHYHTKYLYTVAKIVKTKDTNVTIFTTSDLFLKLKTYIKNIDDYEIILKEKNESISRFLKRVEKICSEKIDLLFVNTIQETILDLPRFLSFKPKCKLILTIHSVNSWFSMKPEIQLKKIFRTVDTNLSKIFVRFFVLPKFDGINVIYPPIKDYVKQKTNYKKPVFKIPFGFHDKKIDEKLAEKKYNELLFVVPGQIEEHRRDYETVINAFEKIFEKNNEKTKLILLGYPVGVYGRKILKKCEELKEKGYNITYYDSFVPEEEYNNIMKTVAFLILPIKLLSYGLGVTKEYYGLTKGSAAVFEAIQYGKPMIVPDNFNMVKEMESSTIKYKNTEHLGEKIQELIKNKKILDEYKSNALKDSDKFSITVLQKYFTEEILDKIDSI